MENINLITKSAVEYKNCYKWTGTVTASTTGQFLYLEGDTSKPAPFANNVRYMLDIYAFTKDLTTNLSCGIEYSNGQLEIMKIGGVYPIVANNYITDSTSFAIAGQGFQDPADPYTLSGIGTNAVIDGDIIKFEVTSNNIDNDCELTLFVFIDNKIDLTDYL